MAQLDSASDLQGTDLGNGDVRLAWSWPGDIVAQNIVFDVYGSDDPLDVAHVAFAQGVPALTTTLSGFGFSGDRYFTVVARRVDQISLPAKILALAVAPPPSLVTVTGGTGAAGGAGQASDTGVGFPFGITNSGSVFAQTDDALLRSKLLQLLLTVPGERVNLPDYGTRLLELVFDPNSDVLAATTEFYVTRAIQKYLGDEIQIDRVQITNDDETLNVDISYLKKSDLRAEQVRIGLPLPTGPGT